MNQPTANLLSRPISRRLSIWILVTIVFPLALLIAYPALVCGCHFHPEALWISIPPIAWGPYCFLFARTIPERILSYIALVFSIGWAWVAWDSNVVFYFMWSQRGGG